MASWAQLHQRRARWDQWLAEEPCETMHPPTTDHFFKTGLSLLLLHWEFSALHVLLCRKQRVEAAPKATVVSPLLAQSEQCSGNKGMRATVSASFSLLSSLSFSPKLN